LAIAATKQSVGDRVGIMNDAMALATANLAKLSSALTLIEGLIGETECKQSSTYDFNYS
jgi:hypothetical protein